VKKPKQNEYKEKLFIVANYRLIDLCKARKKSPLNNVIDALEKIHSEN